MSDGRATSNHAAKRTIGVGSPGIFKLELFGRVLMDAFGFNAYLVGSNVLGKGGRDVDVVVMLPDDAFDEMFPDRDKPDRWNLRWAAYCHAFSALGAEMTGLPVDFKLQRISDANEKHAGPREPLVAHVPRESEREALEGRP